jgi:hypothetical protein
MKFNKNIYPDGVSSMMVAHNTYCESCGADLQRGNIVYEDNYRGDKFCDFCLKEHEEAIILEEGENGQLLK